MDWIPILSQAKSFVQAACGDVEGARETQGNFIKTCPIVSQGTSLVQSMSGDKEGALETQKAFVKTISGVANGIPIVGHVKGAIHYALGDNDGGDQALKSSTRSIGKTEQKLHCILFSFKLSNYIRCYRGWCWRFLCWWTSWGSCRRNCRRNSNGWNNNRSENTIKSYVFVLI